MVSRAAKYNGIFGTPPEPIFNSHPLSLTVEMLEDWLVVLAAENEKNMKDASVKQGYFKNGQSAEFVFRTCNLLKISPSAKYLALELFERFMIKHVRHLYSHVQTMSNNRKRKDWMAIMDRVRNQVPLRIVSCCQLASKLTSHYKIVTLRKARDLLAKLGHKYSYDSILQSELRVLKTLDYRVLATSPLTYVEALLEMLGHNDTDTAVKVYHGVCLKVLDLVYLQRSSIYASVFQIVTGKTLDHGRDRSRFAPVESDLMLQAVAVVTAASYVVEQANTDKVIENLSRISLIPSADILDFATIIVKHIVE